MSLNSHSNFSLVLGKPSGLKYLLYDYWEEMGDPRVKDLPLLSGGPWKFWSIILIYLFWVKILGPAWMKNREPYNLKTVILAYNIFLVAINAYFFCAAVYYLDYGRQLANFQYPDRTDQSTREMRKIYLCYLYLWSKVRDFWFNSDRMTTSSKKIEVFLFLLRALRKG